jgi:hypothetical protein
MSDSKSKKPLLSVRAALIMVCALVVGATAAVLTYFGTKQPTNALLTGGASFAGAVIWFDKIIAS